MADSYSILSAELPHNLRQGVLRRSKRFLIRYWYLDGTYSHSGGLPEKQIMLNLVGLPLLRESYGILSHTEEKYSVLSPQVDSAKKKQTT